VQFPIPLDISWVKLELELVPELGFLSASLSGLDLGLVFGFDGVALGMEVGEEAMA